MQTGTAITLPGGALMGGRVVREVAFRPFTGYLEEQVAQILDLAAGPHPARVSIFLAGVLAHIGGEPATPQRVASLGFTDRQFLMFAFALEHRDDEQWRQIECALCRARFDVGFRLSSLPVSTAGAGYPWTQLNVAGKSLRLRVPTGEDEERIAGMGSAAARRTLALACISLIDGAPPSPAELDAFGDADIEAMDAALDAVAPQLATTISTACNECGQAHAVELDPYDMAVPAPRQLYRDVHDLALHYHWNEAEILRLPRERRRLYLDLIDQSVDLKH